MVRHSDVAQGDPEIDELAIADEFFAFAFQGTLVCACLQFLPGFLARPSPGVLIAHVDLGLLTGPQNPQGYPVFHPFRSGFVSSQMTLRN